MHHDTYSCCRDVGKQRWCSNCCGLEFIIAVSVCYIVMWNVKKNTELKDMKNCSKDMKICKNWKKDKQIYQKDQQIRKLQEEMKNHAAKKAHKKFYKGISVWTFHPHLAEVSLIPRSKIRRLPLRPGMELCPVGNFWEWDGRLLNEWKRKNAQIHEKDQ
jgi:hypothetical protein